MSPLLFAIAMEPLAISLRSNPGITGVTRNGMEQKVSLYTNDLLLYVSKPASSFPLVLSILEQFSLISGYTLNLGKSELFPLNAAAQKYQCTALPFRLVSDNCTYLGVKITSQFHNLFKLNFNPLVEKFRQDLDRWSLLHLSVAGRINAIKMNILPKCSFLFHCPCIYPNFFFC